MVVKRGGCEGIVEDGGQERSMKVLQRMVVKRGGCEGDGGQESWRGIDVKVFVEDGGQER